MNIQLALFFSFLKSTKPIKKKIEISYLIMVLIKVIINVLGSWIWISLQIQNSFPNTNT